LARQSSMAAVAASASGAATTYCAAGAGAVAGSLFVSAGAVPGTDGDGRCGDAVGAGETASGGMEARPGDGVATGVSGPWGSARKVCGTEAVPTELKLKGAAFANPAGTKGVNGASA